MTHPDWLAMSQADRDANEALHALFTKAQADHAKHLADLDKRRRKP